MTCFLLDLRNGIEMTSFAARAFSSYYISGDFPEKISVTLKPQINFPRHICVLKQRLVKTQKRRCSLKVRVARSTEADKLLLCVLLSHINTSRRTGAKRKVPVARFSQESKAWKSAATESVKPPRQEDTQNCIIFFIAVCDALDFAIDTATR